MTVQAFSRVNLSTQKIKDRRPLTGLLYVALSTHHESTAGFRGRLAEHVLWTGVHQRFLPFVGVLAVLTDAWP